LRILAVHKKQNQQVFSLQDENLPHVSIIIAAYNEEEVIENKINSTFNTTYPAHLFDVHIGSDNSSDRTNEIITAYSQHYSQLHLHVFSNRQGKATIINKLVAEASSDIIILTDANVFFEPSTMFELVKHYKNPDIALVGGYIINTNVKKTGISLQEKTYLSHENLIKYREGILWGSMIGAFGGVYSIRKENYTPVPENYFMDDFFITMSVLQQGKKTIAELNAVCYEDISNIIHEEFRRKVRISIGNFQNLSTYGHIASRIFTGAGFSFFSHKVLRWMTPFLLIDCLIASAILFSQDILYSYLFFGQIILLLLPVIDIILKRGHIHVSLLRFITHFYSMNVALFIGFFKFLKGVDSNVWQPTKRNQ
jgi:cellulose synthase/poly-beta-1,6-N-acetylglucosamine synthase-like glycosyltransferase